MIITKVTNETMTVLFILKVRWVYFYLYEAYIVRKIMNKLINILACYHSYKTGFKY